MKHHLTIDDETMAVLRRSTVDANSVKLPESPRLERKLYEKVNKVLVTAGGKWNRSAQVHLFPSDPREVLGDAIVSHCATKGIPPKKVVLTTRQLNAILEATTTISNVLAWADRPSSPGMGLVAWLQSDDTGLSSRAMAYHLLGAPLTDGSRFNEHQAHPVDSDDFGRCYRFLESVPEAVAGLSKMSAVSPVWSKLIEHWPALCGLYEAESVTGKFPGLNIRLQALGV